MSLAIVESRASLLTRNRETAGLVYGSGEHRVTGALGYRNRFAGQGRLIQTAFSLADNAIERDCFAGPDQDDVANLQFLERHPVEFAIFPAQALRSDAISSAIGSLSGSG